MNWKVGTVLAVVIGIGEAVYLWGGGAAAPPNYNDASHRMEDGIVTVERTDADRLFLASEIVSGTDLTGQFRIANATSVPVTVTLTGKSCGCTSVVVNGASARVGDHWTLGARRQMKVELTSVSSGRPGRRRQTAYFTTAARDRTTTVTLDWDVEILADVDVAPQPVQIRLARKSDPGVNAETPTLCHVTTRRRADAGTDELFEPELDNLPEGTRIGSAEHLSRTRRPDGVLEDAWQFRLLTRDGEWPNEVSSRAHQAVVRVAGVNGLTVEQVFGVLIHVPSHIRYPAAVDMGTVAAGETRRRRILLMSTERKPFSVIGVTSPVPTFEGRISGSDNSFQSWLEIRFCPDRAGHHSCELVLATDHPGCETLTISCTGRGTRSGGDGCGSADDQVLSDERTFGIE